MQVLLLAVIFGIVLRRTGWPFLLEWLLVAHVSWMPIFVGVFFGVVIA